LKFQQVADHLSTGLSTMWITLQ